ncbi:MAG TPA: cytochrome P450 [Acidimicrobiales bacterium]
MTDVVIDPLELVDPARYGERGYPHELWARMRAEAPVTYIEPPDLEPFWAITKHADVQQVAAQPLRFSSARGITLRRPNQPDFHSDVLVVLDPPRHGPLRRVASPRFTPKAMRARRTDIERIAVELVEDVVAGGAEGEFDFVDRIAAPFPLAVIAWTLGVPREDVGLLHRWTNEVIGKNDPEYRREGESPGQTIKRARGELHAYFGALVEERRREPQDDLVTELAQSDIDGTPLSEEELVSYCELLVEAGNETTRNAISGGLLALTEHPDEWVKLRADPELVPDAAEEILRWVSPISHFSRTATEDTEVHGVTIRAGEQVAIFFASANRDEEVFDDPFAFRVDRRPNPHLAFGFGEHFCMGAHLARVEIDVIFRLLVDRFEGFEVAGPVVRLESIVNGSLKHLPVRYRLA